MQIEINEEVIKEHFAEAVKSVTAKVIGEIVRCWNFDEMVRKIVRPLIEETIDKVVAEQLEKMDELKEIAHATMVKSLKLKLEKAMKIAEENK